jgi:tetrapyrrole methylase family protein/MazG family protein
MDSIPIELPALMRAQKVQSKAQKVGFDWEDVDGAFDKVAEEIDELKFAIKQGSSPNIEEEFGDLLFSCVNVSRFINVDSEEALTASTNKFIARFKIVERLAEEKGLSMKNSSIDELDKLWNEAKEILADE